MIALFCLAVLPCIFDKLSFCLLNWYTVQDESFVKLIYLVALLRCALCYSGFHTSSNSHSIDRDLIRLFSWSSNSTTWNIAVNRRFSKENKAKQYNDTHCALTFRIPRTKMEGYFKLEKLMKFVVVLCLLVKRCYTGKVINCLRLTSVARIRRLVYALMFMDSSPGCQAIIGLNFFNRLYKNGPLLFI